MRSVRSALPLILLAAAACGDSTKPTGPVTVTFSLPIFLVSTGSSARDTARARINFDGGSTIFAPGDTLHDVARGNHSFTGQLDIDYLTFDRTVRIDPNSDRFTLFIAQQGSCRSYVDDADFCVGRNLLTRRGYRRLVCPAGDFGEFCTQLTWNDGLGGTWGPAAADAGNEYIAHAKLLIAGTVGSEMTGAVGNKVAMALYRPGDYSPRTLLHAIGDSARFQAEAWTDARHVPIFPAVVPALQATDRLKNRLGLGVRTTYSLDSTRKDVMLVRFDVTNISADDVYRWVHTDEPLSGHTVEDVYLAPVIDADIGHQLSTIENSDDNATIFPADSLMAAYDLSFNVSTFSTAWSTKPALVGLRLVEVPAGTTSKGILFNDQLAVDFDTPTREENAWRLITAGRTAVPTVTTGACVSKTEALVCTTEAGNEVRMGWSVGPLTLAPGASTSLTVAVLIAEPSAGTFTSSTAVAPANTGDLNSTTRTIYAVAGNLRALAATLGGLSVNGTPAGR